MVKLTADLIQDSLQHINPVREYELVLRGCKIPVLENLGATLNQFDCIDLTDNEIKRLSGLPVLTKLTSLLLSNNRVKRISGEITRSVPNLQVLVMTNNSVEELEDVDHLIGLKKLWMLSLMRNPVAMSRSYRLHIIHKMPQVRILDYKRVTQAERKAAASLFESEEMAANDAAPPAKRKQKTEENLEKKPKLSFEQIERIRDAINKADNIEEIDRLTQMLNSGEFFLDDSTNNTDCVQQNQNSE